MEARCGIRAEEQMGTSGKWDLGTRKYSVLVANVSGVPEVESTTESIVL